MANLSFDIKDIQDNFFILYENLILCKGNIRSAILDPFNSDITLIPNELFDFIIENNRKPVSFICSNSTFSSNNFESLNKLEYLYKNDFVYFGTELDNKHFISLEKNYWSASIIENGIIDYSGNFSLDSVLSDFASIGCSYLQIRIFKLTDPGLFLDNLCIALKNIDSSPIYYIEIFLPYQSNETCEEIWKELSQFKRIWCVYFYNSPKAKSNQENHLKIKYLTGNILNEHACGQVSLEYFAINITNITESHHHNSCLNRKISIDAQGNIKNCPSMKESYGNIRDTTLAEALEKPGFKKYWDINKDKIHVCKDCEFRYICTDCRAYVEDPEDILSKPLKCGYNPYTGEWSEWSTNPLKQKAIDFYGMREMVEGGPNSLLP
jgi:SPASM domain peptide maturase of grasp-with-spasm system